MLKREWVRKTTGSYHTYSSLVKLQPRFLSLQWKTCLSAELQPWCLSFSEGPALGHNTDDDGDIRLFCAPMGTFFRWYYILLIVLGFLLKL